jgi:hypothetical protein
MVFKFEKVRKELMAMILVCELGAIQIIRDTFLGTTFLTPNPVTFCFLMSVFRTFTLGNVKCTSKKVP